MALKIKIKEEIEKRDFLEKVNARITRSDIKTWLLDSEKDYTHAPEQWRNKAWMRSYIEDKYIVFGLVSSRQFILTRELYAVYHGRFAEMLLAHFDADIIELDISPQLDINYDCF